MPSLPIKNRASFLAQFKIQKALDELKRRGVESDYCPRCNASDWNVDLIEIPASSAMSSFGMSGVGGQVFPASIAYQQTNGVMPLLGIVCKNCGNTIFHNLNVLGIYEK